jgi:hypothetical protein
MKLEELKKFKELLEPSEFERVCNFEKARVANKQTDITEDEIQELLGE